MSVRNDALSQERKQNIAREFGFCSTAFLHEAPSPDQPRKVEIFTPNEELPYSAEAVLGTALYIFQKLEIEDLTLSDPQTTKKNGHISSCMLQTKAGIIPTQFDAERQVAVVEVPHNIHIHGRETPADEILAVQRQLMTHPDHDKMKASYPIVSLEQGQTFTLVDFTTCPTLLSQLEVGEAPDPYMDAGWRVALGEDGERYTFCGCMYFLQLQTDFTEEPHVTRLQARMITNGVEEAVTPSGICALAAYLALQKGDRSGRYVYAIEQGIEIGRRSQLCVEVRLNAKGTKVSRLILSGRAAFITEGKLL